MDKIIVNGQNTAKEWTGFKQVFMHTVSGITFFSILKYTEYLKYRERMPAIAEITETPYGFIVDNS